MAYDPKVDGPLRSGEGNDPDDPMFAHEFGDGISPRRAATLAESIMADKSTPSTTPLTESPGSRTVNGPPQGYGKYGDLA
jgi:hypothetical protein